MVSEAYSNFSSPYRPIQPKTGHDRNTAIGHCATAVTSVSRGHIINSQDPSPVSYPVRPNLTHRVLLRNGLMRQ